MATPSNGLAALDIYQSTVHLRNSILVNNSGQGGQARDCDASLTTNVNNYIGTSIGSGCNGSVSGNLMLGALTGSPAYYPLQAGSVALDAANSTYCTATDQRGLTRPQGSACDIGAYELDVVTPVAAVFSCGASGLTISCNASGSTGDGLTYAWAFGDGGTSTQQNPSYTYSSASTYTVGLTVTDGDGATDFASQLITVTAPVVPPDGDGGNGGTGGNGGSGDSADGGGAKRTQRSRPHCNRAAAACQNRRNAAAPRLCSVGAAWFRQRRAIPAG